MDLLHERYFDFRPTLGMRLREEHYLPIWRESEQRLQNEEGLWKPKRAKQPPGYQMRHWHGCWGVVQIGGGVHDWSLSTVLPAQLMEVRQNLLRLL